MLDFCNFGSDAAFSDQSWWHVQFPYLVHRMQENNLATFNYLIFPLSCSLQFELFIIDEVCSLYLLTHSVGFALPDEWIPEMKIKSRGKKKQIWNFSALNVANIREHDTRRDQSSLYILLSLSIEASHEISVLKYSQYDFLIFRRQFSTLRHREWFSCHGYYQRNGRPAAQHRQAKRSERARNQWECKNVRIICHRSVLDLVFHLTLCTGVRQSKL